MLYLASASLGRPLVSGFFWIGFQTRSNGRFQIGVLSERFAFGRVPTHGFTLLEVLWDGRNRCILFMNYLVPDPNHNHDLTMEEQPHHITAHQPNDSDADVADEPKPVRDALKLLLSVATLPFLSHTCPLNRFHDYCRFPIGWFRFLRCSAFESDR